MEMERVVHIRLLSARLIFEFKFDFADPVALDPVYESLSAVAMIPLCIVIYFFMFLTSVRRMREFLFVVCCCYYCCLDARAYF